jgi:hypothetical protein
MARNIADQGGLKPGGLSARIRRIRVIRDLFTRPNKENE